MIKRLAHVCLYINDLDATEAFYRDALGLEIQFDFIRNDAPFGYYLKVGNTSFIEVFKGDPGTPGNINHLCLECDDMDAVIQKIRDAGHEVSDKIYGDDFAYQCWLTDPNGVRIELHEYTDKSLQHTGGTCYAKW
ncbi:MAG: VOC family protein [Planctomycetota bacterium]